MVIESMTICFYGKSENSSIYCLAVILVTITPNWNISIENTIYATIAQKIPEI